jgi:hypothetical protein
MIEYELLDLSEGKIERLERWRQMQKSCMGKYARIATIAEAGNYTKESARAALERMHADGFIKKEMRAGHKQAARVAYYMSIDSVYPAHLYVRYLQKLPPLFTPTRAVKEVEKPHIPSLADSNYIHSADAHSEKYIKQSELMREERKRDRVYVSGIGEIF